MLGSGKAVKYTTMLFAFCKLLANQSFYVSFSYRFFMRQTYRGDILKIHKLNKVKGLFKLHYFEECRYWGLIRRSIIARLKTSTKSQCLSICILCFFFLQEKLPTKEIATLSPVIGWFPKSQATQIEKKNSFRNA